MTKKEYDLRIKKYSNMTVSSQPDVLGQDPKLFCMFYHNKSKVPHLTNDEMILFMLRKKKLADSYCSSLWESLMGNNNHYVVAFDVLFDRAKRDFYIPALIPVLEKQVRLNEDGIFGEVAGSRLSSLMGIDTVYNFAPTYNGKLPYDPSEKSTNEEDKFCRSTVLSVDYTAQDWQEYTFNDIVGGRGTRNNNTLEQNLNMINVILPLAFKAKTKIMLTDEQLEHIKITYVKQYLFRVLLCRDSDFYARNAGIMYNLKTKEVKSLPNFDMECCFSDIPESEESRENERDKVISTINFCLKNYPNILSEFMQKIITLAKKGAIIDCMQTALPEAQSDMLEKKQDIMKYQLNLIGDCYKNSLENQSNSSNTLL